MTEDSITYRTREGDNVDWIAWKHYGHQTGTAEAILEANRGLADYGLHLPGNLLLTIPELETQPAQETVRLWD